MWRDGNCFAKLYSASGLVHTTFAVERVLWNDAEDVRRVSIWDSELAIAGAKYLLDPRNAGEGRELILGELRLVAAGWPLPPREEEDSKAREMLKLPAKPGREGSWGQGTCSAGAR
jgi:hypothetical protein